MKLLMQFLVIVSIVINTFSNASFTPDSIYGDHYVRIFQHPILPGSEQLVLTKRPSFVVQEENQQHIHNEQFSTTITTTDSQLHLLETSRNQEKLIKTEIENLIRNNRVSPTTTERFITEYSTLWTQLEVIEKQIQQLLATQQTTGHQNNKNSFQHKNFITDKTLITDAVKVTSNPNLDGDNTKVYNNNYCVEGKTEAEALDLLLTLIDQRDLINLQIEEFIKRESLQNTEQYQKSPSTDILSALHNQRDLLNLQISHILTIPGFENKFSGQFQILTRPQQTQPIYPGSPINSNFMSTLKPPHFPSTGHLVEKPINVLPDKSRPISKQTASSNGDTSHAVNNSQSSGTTKEIVQQSTIQIQLQNVDSTKSIKPDHPNFDEQSIKGRPKDLINLLEAQKKLINAEIDHLLAIRMAEKKFNDQIRNFKHSTNIAIETSSQYYKYTQSSNTMKNETSTLLAVLRTQVDLINAQIQHLRPQQFSNLTEIHLFTQIGLVELIPTAVLPGYRICSNQRIINNSNYLNSLIAQRDSIHRELSKLLPVRRFGLRPNYELNKITFLEIQRILLNNEIQYILACRNGQFINNNIYLDFPGHVIGAGIPGSNLHTSPPPQQPFYVLPILLAEGEFIQVQIAHLRSVLEAEKIVHYEMDQLRLNELYKETTTATVTSHLMYMLMDQKQSIDYQIEKLMLIGNEKNPNEDFKGIDKTLMTEVATTGEHRINSNINQSTDVLNTLLTQRNALNIQIDTLLPFRENFERDPEELSLFSTLEAQRDLINLQIKQMQSNLKEEQKIHGAYLTSN